jgi:hypothetical protein
VAQKFKSKVSFEAKGKLLAISPCKKTKNKKLIYSQHTMAQSKHFHSKREEWGIEKKDRAKATPKLRRANIKSCSTTSGNLGHVNGSMKWTLEILAAPPLLRQIRRTLLPLPGELEQELNIIKLLLNTVKSLTMLMISLYFKHSFDAYFSFK